MRGNGELLTSSKEIGGLDRAKQALPRSRTHGAEGWPQAYIGEGSTALPRDTRPPQPVLYIPIDEVL
jgi:hypothetical protein